MTRHRFRDWREEKQPSPFSQFQCGHSSQTHHALWVPANSLCVTEAALSAAQADTLYSPAPGFAESEPCDRSSQPSVAGRHLHHARYKLHGAALAPCTQSLPRAHILCTRVPDVWVIELNIVSCFNDSLITQKYGKQCDKQWSTGKIWRQTWQFFISDKK